MPLTWFAHQVPVVGMKMARPKWFDGCALVFGSMAPDVTFAISGYLGVDGHQSPAIFTVALPIALLMSVAFRRVVAPVIPTSFPDVGRFRLRSFGVLSQGAPRWWVTLISAFLGVGSHVVLDWFTHEGRPGVRWLGYDNVVVIAFGQTESLAEVFQLFGHSVGSLVGIWLLWVISQRRLLEAWYGDAAVDRVRSESTSPDRWIVWSMMAVGAALGMVWGLPGDLVERVHRPALGMFVGLVAGAAVVTSRRA